MRPSHYLINILFDAFLHRSPSLSWPTFSGMSIEMKEKICKKIAQKSTSSNSGMVSFRKNLGGNQGIKKSTRENPSCFVFLTTKLWFIALCGQQLTELH